MIEIIIFFLIFYIIVSVILWNYPDILHKRKNVVFNARNISHRGGAGENYENTIKAFQRSLDSGSDMLEIDVRCTLDDKIVVLHDLNLLRLTGQNCSIDSIEYKNLDPIKTEIEVETCAGLKFSDHTWTNEERRIPLLSEVFEKFPKTPIHLDVCGKAPTCCKVAEIIKQFNRGKLTVWESSEFSLCQTCYNSKNMPLKFFSIGQTRLTVLFAFCGLLPFVPINETHYSVFLPQSFTRLGLGWGLPPWLIVAVRTFGKIMVNGSLIRHLQRRGIQVYLWVCNDSSEFEACDKIGADGIITDYPSLLNTYFNNRINKSKYKRN